MEPPANSTETTAGASTPQSEPSKRIRLEDDPQPAGWFFSTEDWALQSCNRELAVSLLTNGFDMAKVRSLSFAKSLDKLLQLDNVLVDTRLEADFDAYDNTLELLRVRLLRMVGTLIIELESQAGPASSNEPYAVATPTDTLPDVNSGDLGIVNRPSQNPYFSGSGLIQYVKTRLLNF